MALHSLILPSAANALVFGSVALIVYFALLSVYRVFFHPLATYPGPLQYKLSGWPRLWQAYKGNRHIWHLKDHEKYGPIVRIAPDALSFNSASALNTIYGPRSANVRKSEWYKTFDIAAGTYSSFTEFDKEKHATKRRWISPVFTTDSIKSGEPTIINVIERFCETIRPATGEWGESWNAAQITTYLGLDIMGALTFGCDFRSVQEEENRVIANSILPASKFLYWVSYLPCAVLVRPLLRTRLFKIVGGRPVTDNNRLIDYAQKQVEMHRAENEGKEKGINSGRPDFLARLVGTVDKKNGWRPTTADLDVESLNIMNAGADPFSGVMSGLIFYLVHNEEVLQKATAEVRSTFASADKICNGPKLNSCAYLYACIEETLRRVAPVPSHLPREVLPGGMTIDGHYLPAGTVVGSSAYAIHHNAEYFPDPWAFRPERWIESDKVSSESISLARRAFEPYGLGIRQCAGKSLAYVQLKLTIAHLLYRFDMRLDPNEPGRGAGAPGLGVGRERTDEFQLYDALGFGRDGPMVQVKIAN